MTRIKEVLQIAVMGVKFFHVMVPLEDMEEFTDANIIELEYWCARSKQHLQFYL